jgi:hypothetical protein
MTPGANASGMTKRSVSEDYDTDRSDTFQQRCRLADIHDSASEKRKALIVKSCGCF